MPLNEQVMAKALDLVYQGFLLDLGSSYRPGTGTSSIGGKTITYGNNNGNGDSNGNNGGNDSSSGTNNGSNSNSNGEASGVGSGSSSGTGTGVGSNGTSNGNGSDTSSPNSGGSNSIPNTNNSGIITTPYGLNQYGKPILRYSDLCPIHGKKEKLRCPVCGHTDCGCSNTLRGQEILKDPIFKIPATQLIGNEINADNWDDLVAANDADNLAKGDPTGSNTGTGSGTGNGDNDGSGNGDGNSNPDGSGDGNNNNNGNGGGSSSPGGGSGSGGSSDSGSFFLDLFSKTLDANLQMATPMLPNCSILMAAGTLFISKKDNPILYAVEIATKVMLYWTICVAPLGTPVAGPIIMQITPNAAALALPMAIDILTSTMNAKSGDNFLPLATIICDYSRKVQYQVTEQVGPATVPYVVGLT